MSRAGADGALDEIFRAEYGRLVATLIRMLGDFDRAEELVQEALVAALERWPLSGVPENPGAWLMTTARNRALDHLRREKRLREKRPLIAAEQEESAPAVEDAPPGPLADDRLRLIYTCCHPALPPESRSALTLRLVGGLTTREIASAFLVSEATASQRIVRAKRAIRDRRLSYRVPEASELPERLASVLEVIYLIFNEGYAAREGDSLLRVGLCDEALRLARLLEEHSPEIGEVQGLLALIELHSSRQAERTDAKGDLVLLEDQDRSRWDRVGIERARRRVERAFEDGRSRSVRAPGGDRPLSCAGALVRRDRLAPHRDALHRARARHRVAGGGAEPRGGGRDGGGSRGGSRAARAARRRCASPGLRAAPRDPRRAAASPRPARRGRAALRARAGADAQRGGAPSPGTPHRGVPALVLPGLRAR